MHIDASNKLITHSTVGAFLQLTNPESNLV